MPSQPESRLFPKWSLVEMMLAVLLVLAPLYYHPNLGGEGLRLPNNIMLWLVATLFIAWSFWLVLKRRELILPRYFWLIAAFPILATLSGFIAGVEQPLKWAFRLLFIWGGLAFFVALFQHGFSRARWDRLLFLLVAAALIHALAGLLQIGFKLDLPFWLPKNPDGVPTSYFQQINNHASFQVTALIISLYLLSRPMFRQGRLLQKAVIFLSVIAGSFIVGISGSRIGFLGLLIALPIALIALKPAFQARKKLLLVFISLFAVSFSTGLFFSGDRLADKTTAMQAGYSGDARLGMYSMSWDLIKQKPVFGHGIGSFPRVWQYAKPDFYQMNPDAKLPGDFVSHPHNELIQWAVEGGITAVAGLVILLSGTIWLLSKNQRRGWVYGAMLVPLAIHTQVEMPFYISAMSYLCFLTSLAVAFSVRTRRYAILLSSMMTVTLRVVILFLVGLLTVFYTHTQISNWDFYQYFLGAQQDSEKLPVARHNVYLSNEANWILQSGSLYTAIEADRKDVVNAFTRWAEKKLETRPDRDLYLKLIAAYEYLGRDKAYCFYAEQAHAMYPSSDETFWQVARACKQKSVN